MASSAELVWLLAASAKGDVDAFQRLYEATCAKIFGVVLRIVRQTGFAEDIMQQAYFRIWRDAGAFDPRSVDPLTWMVGVARDEAFTTLRKQAGGPGRGQLTSAELDSGEHGHPILPDRISEPLRGLLASMGGLDEETRRVLLFAYYNGWSRAQLAEKFGASPEAMAARLRDALTHIRSGEPV